MVWSELVESARFGRPKKSQVLVLGEAPHSLRPANTHTVGFQSHAPDNNGEDRARIDVFAVTRNAAELLGPLAGAGCTTWAIICLDWLGDTTRWLAEINAWIASLTPIEPDHIVISVAHFDKVQQQMASATFDSDVEICQTVLRIAALKYNAALIYERPGFDWIGLVSGHHFDAQVIDDVTIPAGWDTKERILATSPEGNFEDIMSGAVGLPRLRLASALPLPTLLPTQAVEEVDFAAVLRNASKPGVNTEYTLAQTSTPPPDSRPQTPEVSDKQALDHFFSYLIDRSK